MQIIGYALVCFFCVYGFLQMTFYILDLILETRQLKHKKIYTVVFVKNEEDTIESTIRALLWKAVRNDNGVSDREITVIDMGSSDETVTLIKALERESSAVRLRTLEEFAGHGLYEVTRFQE